MPVPIPSAMDNQDHFDEHYNDHYAHEHDYPPDHTHPTHGDLNHYTNDDLFYEAGHDDASIDYEPPSPSYPYTEAEAEDQQPPDSELAIEDLDPRNVSPRNPRHVSELYNDTVSGTELDQGSSVISEYLRSKDPYWDNVQERTEPLNLLELPVDVLRLIVKEVRQSCVIRLPPLPSRYANLRLDYTHKRPHFSGAYKLDLSQPRHPAHLLALRYSMA